MRLFEYQKQVEERDLSQQSQGILQCEFNCYLSVDLVCYNMCPREPTHTSSLEPTHHTATQQMLLSPQ